LNESIAVAYELLPPTTLDHVDVTVPAAPGWVEIPKFKLVFQKVVYRLVWLPPGPVGTPVAVYPLTTSTTSSPTALVTDVVLLVPVAVFPLLLLKHVEVSDPVTEIELLAIQQTLDALTTTVCAPDAGPANPKLLACGGLGPYVAPPVIEVPP
jgi:hypothetical protein